jgi:hypothetical protein
VEPTHSPHFPGANKPISTSISTPEWQFLQVELLLGKFSTPSEAYRHYLRRGLQAEGKFEEALRFG